MPTTIKPPWSGGFCVAITKSAFIVARILPNHVNLASQNRLNVASNCHFKVTQTPVDKFLESPLLISFFNQAQDIYTNYEDRKSVFPCCFFFPSDVFFFFFFCFFFFLLTLSFKISFLWFSSCFLLPASCFS